MEVLETRQGGLPASAAETAGVRAVRCPAFFPLLLEQYLLELIESFNHGVNPKIKINWNVK